MDFGHGFIPRIDSRNAVAVERALGAPGQLAFETPELDLPWVIVDAFCGAAAPNLVAHLHERGTKVLVDTQAWRYRDPRTFAVPKHRDAPWAAAQPLVYATEAELRTFVRRDLRTQAELGADAYLLPGALPVNRNDDILVPTQIAADEALSSSHTAPRPLVSFVGVHPQALDLLGSLLDQLHQGVAAVYVQPTSVEPLRDSPSRLADLVSALVACRKAGFQVVAGHMGAIGPLLSAFGIDAADAGLGQAERFVAKDKLRLPRPRSERTDGGGWGGPSIYVGQLGRSIHPPLWRHLVAAPELRGRFTCTAPCCRFRTLDTTIVRAIEHSLHGRVADAARVRNLEPALRFDVVAATLEERRSMVALCNSVLVCTGHPPVDVAYLDHQIGAMARVGRDRRAA